MRYRLHAALVLFLLFLFLLVYILLLAGALGLVVWSAWPRDTAALASAPWHLHALLIAVRVGVFAFAVMLFVFVLKGFAKRGEDDAARYVEITEAEQPELFQFLRSLCREIGCAVPAGVFVNHEVNAAIFYPTSVVNLFVAPPRNLLLGLGLVNCINLMEFKAVLAHELGHFSQRTLRIDGHVWIAYRVIDNMVGRRDRWDNLVIQGFDTPWLSAFAVPLYAFAESMRALLKWMFRVINPVHLSLRRQMEFNADQVAVSVTGSDALVHALLKSSFAEACLQQSAYDLSLAAEQGLLTRDLFLHQERSRELVRTYAKDPKLGHVPELPADPALPSQVFERGKSNAVPMWADHPSEYDREQHAKQPYVRSPQDDRSAWLLFRDRPSLCDRVSLQYYRLQLGHDPETPLADAERVQSFIDEEHAAAVFDPRYRGIYDNRYLELESIQRLLESLAKETPPPEQLQASLEELYGEQLVPWVAESRRRHDELRMLSDQITGRGPAGASDFEFRGRRHDLASAQDLMDMVQQELQEDRRYLSRLDERVFTLHARLAERLGKHEELRERYTFHLELQRTLQIVWDQKTRVESLLQFFYSHPQVQWADVMAARESLAHAAAWLGEVYSKAASLTLPDLKNLKLSAPLDSLLPARPAVPEVTAADSYAELNLRGLEVFNQQLSQLADRLGRIHVKSLGKILQMQETNARAFRESSS